MSQKVRSRPNFLLTNMAFTLQGDTDIAALGELLGDSSRCRVLLALADGRPLSAGHLAAEAGVAPSTASGHLGKLVEAGMIKVEIRGRHRYYSLAGPHVARLLETLAQYSPQKPIRSLREGTRAYALRQARHCYDHLGGRLAVGLMDALLRRGVLIRVADHSQPDAAANNGASTELVEYALTPGGANWLRDFGIDVEALQNRRRVPIRYCVDWSERRHHLAGGLGHALAERLFELGWLEPGRHSRVLTITPSGTTGLATQLGITLDVTPNGSGRDSRVTTGPRHLESVVPASG